MKNSYDIFFSSDFDCNLMISSFFLLLCIGKSRKKHIFRGNKGVRKDSECVDVKHIWMVVWREIFMSLVVRT